MSKEVKSTSSGRSRTVESELRPPCKIDPTAIIAEKAHIVGSHQVTIGPNCVVHPYAKIDATYAPVVISSSCIIFEKAIVGITRQAAQTSAGVTLGHHVLVETRAKVEARSVGNCSVVGVCSELGPDSVLGKYCKVQAKEILQPGQSLPDFTTLYGHDQTRENSSLRISEQARTATERGMTMQIDLFRRLIPSNIAKWAI